MSYDDSKIVSGKEPFEIVEIDLDACKLIYGTSPCTAAGASGSECYNTRSTCQDTANFSKVVKTYRFCTAGVKLPVGDTLIPCINSVSLRSPEINPVESIGVRGSSTVTFNDFPHHDRNIDPYVDNRSYDPEAQGTFFGKLKARNKFYASRPARVYTGFFDEVELMPELITNPNFLTDTDWVKETGWTISGAQAIALNAPDNSEIGQSIQATEIGREYEITYKISGYSSGGVRIILRLSDEGTNEPSGELRNTNGIHKEIITVTQANQWIELQPQGSTTLDIDYLNVRIVPNFLEHKYLIDSLSGIDSRGKVTLKAKDPLKLTAKEKATCPIATDGVLAAAITGTPATFTLSPSGVGNDEYAASGYVRIEDEIIQFTRSGDIMTVVARGAWGSTSSDHAIDENVQQSQSWTDINVIDIVDDLIRDFTDIDNSFIDATGWATEKAGLLSSQNLTAIITEPEGVDKLLNELIEQNLFDLWWDDRNSLIKVRSFIPNNVNAPPSPLGDQFNFLKGKTKQSDKQDKLVTQVRVVYEPRDYTEASQEKDFKYAYIAANTDSEGADQYNLKNIKTIYSRWFNDSNRGQAIALASRLLQRFNAAPVQIEFSMDVKDDSLAIADNFRTDTRANQDVDGSNKDIWMQVISVQEDVKNSLVKYKSLSLELVGPYGYIAPNSAADYGSASDADKAAYCWICLDTGLFSNGDDGYLII